MIEQLKTKIMSRKARVCIIGLGYVGLPLAVEAARVGFDVLGIDVDAQRVEMFNSGQDYVAGHYGHILKELCDSGKIIAKKELTGQEQVDIFVICVPTGLDKNLLPDLQHLERVTQSLTQFLRAGQLVSVESTVYPGTTRELVGATLETGGLKVGEDFFLVYSPERIDPGNEQYGTKNTSKLVAGIDQSSLELGSCFYRQFLEQIVEVESVEVAELAKIHENTFRSVNIAMVNELAILCDRMGVSIWSVLEAAFTKPFGIMPFYPGPGVGGHCIPIDPHYLEWRAREFNFLTRFIVLAGEINRGMPEFVRKKLYRILNSQGLAPSRSKVLLLGISYKRDTNDLRESPALELAQELIADGVDLKICDPYVTEVEVSGKTLLSEALTDELVPWSDVVVIAADHSCYDYAWLVARAKAVLDTRNATRAVQGRENKVTLL